MIGLILSDNDEKRRVGSGNTRKKTKENPKRSKILILNSKSTNILHFNHFIGISK
jgi:hypothetical protein